jgi:hypothetical protein
MGFLVKYIRKIDRMGGPLVTFLIVLIKDSIGGYESAGYTQQLTVKTVQYRASEENKIGPMVIR